MEAEKTLTNEEIIRELLDLLKKNTMKEQANDVFEICTYVDGLWIVNTFSDKFF